MSTLNDKKEIWKSIKGYKGLYEVSNMGRVRSIERIVKYRTGWLKLRKSVILLPFLSTGYHRVALSKKCVRKQIFVHRLVLFSFTKNKHNKPQVNHKNGIKTDNRLENLEWATRSENQLHRFMVLKKYRDESKVKHRIGANHPNSVPVVKLDLGGNYMDEYVNITEAAIKNNIKNKSNFPAVLRGHYGRKTIGGFKWVYKSQFLQQLNELTK